MQWTVHGERQIYRNPWVNLWLVDVEQPDGRRWEHHVVRMRHLAVAAVLDDRRRVLMMWRHRFITDSWGWELAAGVVEHGEDIEVAAAREMLEETGWRPGPLRHLLTVEPSNGLTDGRHHVYWSTTAEYVGHPEDDFESDRREWVPLASVPSLIARGEIHSANAVAALLLLHLMHAGGETQVPFGS